MLIDFIIPSFNDDRLLGAISSIIDHNDAKFFRIIIQEGSENKNLHALVKNKLRPHDILAVESDDGIFDALNRGLEKVDSDWIGWIGADDRLLPEFDLSILINSHGYDVVSFSTKFVNSNGVLERHYRPVKSNLMRKVGFHLPHFSSFVRVSQKTKNLRFNTEYGTVCDILYFLRLESLLAIKTVPNLTSTEMESGGTSNMSISAIIKNNQQVFKYMLRDGYNIYYALFFVINKLLYKLYQKFYKCILK